MFNEELIHLKRALKILLLICIAASLLGVCAYAAGTDNVAAIYDLQTGENVTVTPLGENGAAITSGRYQINGEGAFYAFYLNAVKLKVTVTDAGAQYYLIMAQEDSQSGLPTRDNLRYIDQKAPANGSVEFIVYPNPEAMTNGKKYVVYLAGTGGSRTEIASFKYFSDARSKLTGSVKITTQPKTYVGAVGSMATFTVGASGEGLTYQWWVKAASSSSFVKSSITGTTYSVPLTEARNGNQVYCVVTDKYGSTARTNTVSMNIGQLLEITTQPKDYSGAVGSTATFTVGASGEGLTYQWWVKVSGSSTFTKSSITGTTYSVALTQARNGNQVYCVVTDKSGNTVKTNTVTMTIAP